MIRPWVCAAATAASLLLSASGAQAAWKESVLFSFNGKNGFNPDGGLTFDAAGNLYGATAQGGKFGFGAVFKLTPPDAGKTVWAETVLFSFKGTDAQYPSGNLIFDAAGNLYGVAGGGKSGFGTVFKLAPPAPGKTSWSESVLASFNGTNGQYPSTGLIFDAAGNLYGATIQGGKFGLGAVYKLTPPAAGKTAWKETILTSFDGIDDKNPNGNLIFDAAGNLYGAASGTFSYGTVFKLTPPVADKTAWKETILAYFSNETDGRYPSDLTFDKAGNLYGVTAYGGTTGVGTVFKLTPPAAGEAFWTQTVLVSFNGGDGDVPDAAPIIDAAGNLYGVTEYGNGNAAVPFAGNVYKLTPPAAGKTAWKETILMSFNGNDGLFPVGSLTLDTAGNLYGATYSGGKAGDGNIFKLTP